MSLYIYKKSGQQSPPEPPPQLQTPSPPSPAKLPKLRLQTLPALTSIIGLVLITFVVWPILSYELTAEKTTADITRSGLLTPLVERSSSTVFAAAPKIVGSVDYTKANNWFPQAQQDTGQLSGPKSYALSVPKLRIDEANVIIGSNDLSKSLIHYADTALPGQLGSPVVFGHSILPQFYSPTNYNSIFSLLPTLERDDEITIKYDSVTYLYKIIEKEEVMPEDLWVLEQHYDSKRLKLITCVPPGLKTKRLVVTAELTQI